MIQSLHISNYALIDKVDIELTDGLNIITGETGAGKSIMLGALSLLLGERAEQRVVRDRDRKSIIEAVFTGVAKEQIITYCEDNEIEWVDDALILRREVAPNGRSRAFVNDSPVTLEKLRGLAIMLVDLHSQHQNLLLADSDYQLRIIDALAENQQILDTYQTLYQSYKNAVVKFRKLRREIEAARNDEEYTRFQLAKFQEINLVDGEQEELERERDLMTNIAEVKQNLAAITNLLADGDNDALSTIKSAVDAANAIGDVIEDNESLVERLESIRIELKDIADTYSDHDNDINADPNRLQYVEERLNDIYQLQRKYQVDTVEALIELQHTLESRLNSITNGEDQLQALESKARQAKAKAIEVAEEISQRRIKASIQFAAELQEKAIPLGMKNINCDIKVCRADMSNTGIDHVDFLFAFNKNQQPVPVRETASGGEISRLMLVIKSIVANKMQLPTIIFDEIDTGVSGEVALRMGTMMVDISKSIQVIAITHLPQVAAQGCSHFKVYKEDDDTNTHTRINRLSETERIDELTTMLSGSKQDEAARAAAISLLRNLN